MKNIGSLSYFFKNTLKLCWVVAMGFSGVTYSQQQLRDDPFTELHRNLKKNSEGNTDLWIQLADYHLKSSKNLDSVYHYGKKIFDWSKRNQDSLSYSQGCWYIGRTAQLQNKNRRASLYLSEATRLAEKYRDTSLFLKGSINFGVLLKSTGKFKKSLEVYKKGLQWSTLGKKHNLTSGFYSNLGVVYRSVGDDDLALTYYLEALKYARLSGNIRNQGIVFTNLSNMYSDKMQLNLSRSYLKRAEKLYLAAKEYGLLAYTFANESNIFLLEEKYDSVYVYANKLLGLKDSIAVQTDALGVAYNNVGEAYIAQKKYDRASRALQTAEQLALEAEDIDLIPHIYKVKSNLYEYLEQPQKSLNYLKKHIAFKDSIYNKKVLQQTVQFESEEALSAKEEKIASLEETSVLQESKYQGLLTWLVGILFIMALGSILGYVYYLRQRTKESELRKEAAENKLEALRNQMNPHFLFNSFNAVQSYILKSDKDKAYNYLTQVAHLIRMVLDHAGNMTIDLLSELEILETYLSLEALRFQDKFNYKLEVNQELKELNPTIPSMVIQPYVENAILHGLSNRQNPGGALTIKLIKEGKNNLICSIEDNGIGRKQAMKIQGLKPVNKQGNNIAMNNTSKRLKILEKAGYPFGEVTVKDLYNKTGEPTGTLVTIKLKIVD